jgi:serine protease Do
MQNRTYGFAAMLAVMGISIVFGMILGGKLNAPPVMLAAQDPSPLQMAPAVATGGGGTDFADIVEQSLPAVVTVTSTARGADGQDAPVHPFFDDPFFRRFWFFGDPEDLEQEPPSPERRIGSGSGFIISPEGFVLTNNHVIEGFDRVEVTTTDGDTFQAEVVGADPSIDLALLKIDASGQTLPTLPLGDSDGLRVGEWVIAIGNPHEFDHTVTVGVVSGKGRRVPLPTTDYGVVSFIQTDAAINLGNSGGPLLDSRGNAVGINTAMRRQNFAEGIGFALPINLARAVVEQLRQYGEVRRGWIGITMNATGIDETTRDYYDLPDARGVLVNQVTGDGPAEKAGLQRWDVIRKVDGEPVRDNGDMIAKISSRRPGDKVGLTVFRGGKTLELKVTLGDRNEGLDVQLGRDRRETPRGREEEPEESSGLGLTVENLSRRAREQLGLAEDQQGVVITRVDFESDADGKGLRPTMVITAVNDQQVGSVSEWERTLERLQPGAPVKLDILPPGGSQEMFFFLRVPDPDE